MKWLPNGMTRRVHGRLVPVAAVYIVVVLVFGEARRCGSVPSGKAAAPASRILARKFFFGEASSAKLVTFVVSTLTAGRSSRPSTARAFARTLCADSEFVFGLPFPDVYAHIDALPVELLAVSESMRWFRTLRHDRKHNARPCASVRECRTTGFG